MASATGSTALATTTNVDELAALFSAKTTLIAQALPKDCGLDATRFAQFALQAAKSEQLRECTALSLYESALECATLGLVLGGSLSHGYLVAYNHKVKGSDGKPLMRAGKPVWERRAQFQLGYRGMVELFRRSGIVRRAIARAVFRGDEFDYWYGTDPGITHRPRGDTDPNALTHVYVVAEFADGGQQFDVMTIDEVLAVMARSKSKDAEGKPVGPWATDFAEMAKKSVVRRIAKLMPMTPDVRMAIETDDERTVDVKASVLPKTQAPGAPKPAAALSHEATGETLDMPGATQREVVDADFSTDTSDEDYGEIPFDDPAPTGPSPEERLAAEVDDMIEHARDQAELAKAAGKAKGLPDALRKPLGIKYEAKRKKLAEAAKAGAR